MRSRLLENRLFQTTNKDVDEDEDSIEKQLPYIAQVGPDPVRTSTLTALQCSRHPLRSPEQMVGGRDIKIVPIMVGSIDPVLEAQYGK